VSLVADIVFLESDNSRGGLRGGRQSLSVKTSKAAATATAGHRDRQTVSRRRAPGTALALASVLIMSPHLCTTWVGSCLKGELMADQAAPRCQRCLDADSFPPGAAPVKSWIMNLLVIRAGKISYQFLLGPGVVLSFQGDRSSGVTNILSEPVW
jgi:hypothetical protein